MEFFDQKIKEIYTDKTDKTSFQQYKVLDNLARGRYGDVQKVELMTNQDLKEENQEEKSKNIYALKSQEIFNGEITKKLQREIDIMCKLKANNNQNVINMTKYFIDGGYLLFLLPFFDSNLQNLLSTAAPFKLDLIRTVTYQLFCGLSYVHSLNILHRDIKPNNILFDTQTQQICIADFGSARDISDVLQNEQNEEENKENIIDNDEMGTISKLTPQAYVVQYRAPELLLGERQYRSSVDMWACACIMAQMCRENGKLLFDEQHDIPLFMQQLQILGGPQGDELKGVGLFSTFFNVDSIANKYNPINKIIPQVLNEDGYDLISKIFVLGPKRRITAKQAVSHTFFDKFKH